MEKTIETKDLAIIYQLLLFVTDQRWAYMSS